MNGPDSSSFDFPQDRLGLKGEEAKHTRDHTRLRPFLANPSLSAIVSEKLFDIMHMQWHHIRVTTDRLQIAFCNKIYSPLPGPCTSVPSCHPYKDMNESKSEDHSKI